MSSFALVVALPRHLHALNHDLLSLLLLCSYSFLVEVVPAIWRVKEDRSGVDRVSIIGLVVVLSKLVPGVLVSNCKGCGYSCRSRSAHASYGIQEMMSSMLRATPTRGCDCTNTACHGHREIKDDSKKEFSDRYSIASRYPEEEDRQNGEGE